MNLLALSWVWTTTVAKPASTAYAEGTSVNIRGHRFTAIEDSTDATTDDILGTIQR